MTRRILCSIAVASLVAPAAAHGAVDPERNSTTPTGWHWWRFQTKQQLKQHASDASERVVDIEIDQADPPRFTAALVRNKGTYKRTGAEWDYGLSATQLKDRTKDLHLRLLDIERYTDANGKRRFAYVAIKNTGTAKKGWWWNYDLTPSQVTDGINEHKVRLVDLDTYVVDGKRRYSYIGIKNKGEDKRAWWWYHNVTPSFVTSKLKEHKARLIDIERPKAGKLTVVMQRQPHPGAYWWWAYGVSQARLEELFQTHGVRIVDVERYLVNGSARYAFVGLSNVNAETARLRGLLEKAYDNSEQFGDKVIRGVYVKRIGGPVLVNLAGKLRFQPLSTLKLLPYTYAMEQIDQGDATMNNSFVDWYAAKDDDPDTDVDETKYASCLSPGPDTTHGRAKWRDALPTMMWESHNRTLDAFLARFKPDVLTTRAQNAWNLKKTEMHYGCPQGDVKAPWAANRTTLADLGKLFEGVDNHTILTKQSSVDLFYGNMINLNYDGAQYTSPITGKTTGPLYNGFLRDIARREAGPGNNVPVENFLKGVVLRGKGGSGGPSGNEFGYSDFLHVTLPFKQNGQTVLRNYVVGWFVYKLKTPPGCPESMAKDGGTCQAIWQPEKDALAKFSTEMHTLPIRQALNTWPLSP